MPSHSRAGGSCCGGCQTPAAPGPPLPWLAGGLARGGFLLVMGPWWLRQLATFGSISPTSSSGAALWIRTISEWNSITAQPSLERFLDQGIGPTGAGRLAGLRWGVAAY